MGILAMEAFVQLLKIIANRSAMQAMRAEMAQGDAKTQAINEGLKASDFFEGLLQRIEKRVPWLRDEAPAAAAPPATGAK